jgi:phosphatidylinositol alpha-mannosyltransferase
VGRFEPRKGLLELLKAYRILRKTGCDCRLLVVGTGPLGREARRYVATRRLKGVEFLGRVTDEEKAQLFRTADIYISPATGGESFGIVLLEAMAAGTPIVASDIHGYKGVVRRGREALLVPPREPKQIAAAVARLLRDDELRAAMSAAGSARAQEFSWERVTAKVDDYYGVVIRRLAAQGQLPASFTATVPPSPRAVVNGPVAGNAAAPANDAGAGALEEKESAEATAPATAGRPGA